MSERDAWLNIVKPAELDAHMASVNQAQTNAALVREMFLRFPLAKGAELLIHGCGSCQMLDYIDIPTFGDVRITFADLSPAMLDEANKRLARISPGLHTLVADDIERTALRGQYDAVLLVLVLLHVEWRTSLVNMIRLGASRLYIIEQEQSAEATSMTSNSNLLPSMRRYSEVAEMVLVPRKEFVPFLQENGYELIWSSSRQVPGNKTMAGFIFQRN